MKPLFWVLIFFLLLPASQCLGVERIEFERTGLKHTTFQRIVSINLCTDQLLYLLADKENIKSVSYLSHDQDYSYLHKDMQQFPVNNAHIEEIIQYQPDLVLAGNYSEAHTIHFLRELDYRVEQIDIPSDMAHIEQGIKQLGILLGKEAKAEKIIADMQLRRQQAEEKIRGKAKPLAVILAPDGFTHGKGSMYDDILTMAGYRNLAAESGIGENGNIGLETLIQAQPDFIIIEDSTSNRNSLSQRLLQHNALVKGLPHTNPIFVHPNLWTCGGPSIINALEILTEAHP